MLKPGHYLQLDYILFNHTMCVYTMLAHSPIPATVCDNVHNGAFSAAPEQLKTRCLPDTPMSHGSDSGSSEPSSEPSG